MNLGKLALQGLACVVCFGILVGCSERCRGVPLTRAPKLEATDAPLVIRQWRVVGAFDLEGPEAHGREFLREAVGVAEDGITAASFSALNTKRMASDGRATTGSAECTADGDYADLGELFQPTARAACFLGALVRSEVDQEVTLFTRCAGPSPDGRKIWLNGELVFDEPRPKRNYAAVRLKKGENFLLVRSNWSGESRWLFHLSFYGMERGRELFYANDIDANFLETAEVPAGGDVVVRLNPAFTRASEAVVAVKDAGGAVVKGPEHFSSAEAVRVPLGDAPPGVFVAELRVDDEKRALLEPFVLGDRGLIFTTLEARARELARKLPTPLDTSHTPRRIAPPLFIEGNQDIAVGNPLRARMNLETKSGLGSEVQGLGSRAGNEREWLNLETLLNRYRFLEAFGTRNGFDHDLRRKLAGVLFALDGALARLQRGQEAFAHLPGLHLRGFRSGIDGSIRNYLLYVPQSYDRRAPSPLVVSMPYIATRHLPFAEGVHVANLKRITMLCRLADKYGLAVLWPDARIFDRRNYQAVVEESVFEAVEEVRRDYAIDPERTHGYGSCTGGLFALLLASRHPGYFATVGVDGPELGYVDDPELPAEWRRANDLFEAAGNLANTPLYVVHSRRDHKAEHERSAELVRRVRAHGGDATLDEMGNPTKMQPLELLLEEEIMPRLFKFFREHKRASPRRVALTTAQLKYGQAFWANVEQIGPGARATLVAEVRAPDTIRVTAENVSRFTVNLAQAPGLRAAKQVKVLTNGKLSFDGVSTDGVVALNCGGGDDGGLCKTARVEGPIAHLFGSAFLVVRGTGGTGAERRAAANAADSWEAYWRKENHGGCRVKDDVAVTAEDLREQHVVLLGRPAEGTLLAGVRERLPLSVEPDGIQIGKARQTGRNLGYALIYPNPVQPDRYLLVTGSNNPAQPWFLPDPQYAGFWDYEIWDLTTMTRLDAGNFDAQWR